MTIFINLFGGPGVGKSTTAARLFSEMKTSGKKVELVTEVAKDFVWEGRMDTLMIQPYVTIKQYRNLFRLKNKVDYVITDAPILLGCMYAEKYASDLPKSYVEFIKDLHNEVLNPSINILLSREFDYDPIGRYQTEKEANQLDERMFCILSETKTDFIKMLPTTITSQSIENLVDNRR